MVEAKHVLLSHAAEDAIFARRLATLISNRGAAVWADSNTTSGEAWSQTFRDEIHKSTALVLLIPSATARNRNNLWFEAGAARALGKRVIAVLPPDRHLVEYPNDLADIIVLDAGRRPLDEIADTLVQATPAREPA